MHAVNIVMWWPDLESTGHDKQISCNKMATDNEVPEAASSDSVSSVSSDIVITLYPEQTSNNH